MAQHVNIVEIGPRDGFQSVKEFIPTEVKLGVIGGLVRAGVKSIECTSFVSPKAIPQMRDAAEICAEVLKKYPKTHFFVLIPNFFGAKAAWDAGIREVCPVVSLSVSHNKANVNRTHAESLAEITKIRNELPDMKITLDVATVFGCPFEGNMKIPPLLDLMGDYHKIGIRAFTLCDTIGVAYPRQVRAVLEATKKAFPDCEFNLHIHDTRNMGIVNTYEGIKAGVDSVQTSIGGLGGCPFAPGASGNTSTEDLVYLLEREGYETGLNFTLLLETAKALHEKAVGSYSGHHLSINVAHADFAQ
jgi:hydroxymethylglutaryl-CoA lyase